jgi:predicted DNA-binding transcriptional regulator
MSKLIIKTDTRELVKSKFTETIAIVEGYFREAKGDVAVGQTYTANAVYSRMARIKETLMKDLEKLAKDIQIDEESE